MLWLVLATFIDDMMVAPSVSMSTAATWSTTSSAGIVTGSSIWIITLCTYYFQSFVSYPGPKTRPNIGLVLSLDVSNIAINDQVRHFLTKPEGFVDHHSAGGKPSIVCSTSYAVRSFRSSVRSRFFRSWSF